MATIVERRPTVEAAADFKSNISNVHHVAYKCRDAEETRHFYEDILGLEFIGALEHEFKGGSDATPIPFLHVFFKMTAGDCIAFFDLGDNRTVDRGPHTPVFVNHISLQVPDETSLRAMWDRLSAHGIEVFYMKDHEFCLSIYFSDPSGNRLEISSNTDRADDYWANEKAHAHDALKNWTMRKGEADRVTA